MNKLHKAIRMSSISMEEGSWYVPNTRNFISAGIKQQLINARSFSLNVNNKIADKNKNYSQNNFFDNRFNFGKIIKEIQSKVKHNQDTSITSALENIKLNKYQLEYFDGNKKIFKLKKVFSNYILSLFISSKQPNKNQYIQKNNLGIRIF